MTCANISQEAGLIYNAFKSQTLLYSMNIFVGAAKVLYSRLNSTCLMLRHTPFYCYGFGKYECRSISRSYWYNSNFAYNLWYRFTVSCNFTQALLDLII